MNEKSGPQEAQNVVKQGHKLLDAMANANRLRILMLLVEEEINVGELAYRLGMTQSSLSQHLTILRAGGLVTARRRAQTVFYSCNSERVVKVLELLETFFAE